MRKVLLATEEIYHIFDRSITESVIFNNNLEFSRILSVIRYYQKTKPAIKFSDFIRSSKNKQENSIKNLPTYNSEKLVEIVAYCVMSTHLHLILKQLKENGISIFMNNILNSWTRYFNTKYDRKGTLWEGKFKNVLVKADEQLLHLTRYIHLNPATAYLVEKPEDWPYSSYREYLGIDNEKRICKYDNILEIEPRSYKKFVEDRISYQRELGKIEKLVLEY